VEYLIIHNDIISLTNIISFGDGDHLVYFSSLFYIYLIIIYLRGARITALTKINNIFTISFREKSGCLLFSPNIRANYNNLLTFGRVWWSR